jgi:hypothetical protein
MNDDLSDVGLNALEALEEKDLQEQENSAPDGEESENTEEEVKEPTSDEDTNEEETETSDNGEAGEKEDEEGESETEEKAGEDEKKELSDEEFEELAKKRGYAKAKTEEETKAEDERAKNMDKLLSRPKEIDEEVWDNIPEENKIIYNALPYITAEGKRGAIQVKTPDQLPDDFEFKSEKAMMKFQNDLQAQEVRATQMKNALDARAEREQRANADRIEAQKVIGEISKLQKSGDLPTPKAKAGTKAFDDDPAVVTINKVLNYRAMRAQQGTNLSVRDSLLLYKAEHPEEFTKKEAKGDIERKNIAKKVAGNSKATSSAVNGNESDKPHYYRAGMSTEDVLDAVLNDMD